MMRIYIQESHTRKGILSEPAKKQPITRAKELLTQILPGKIKRFHVYEYGSYTTVAAFTRECESENIYALIK